MIGNQPDGTFIVERMPESEKPKKMHLSNSQMSQLSQCGEAYRRRYIMHHRSAPTLSMIVGGAVDDAVNVNLFHKIKTGELAEWEKVKDCAIMSFRGKILEAKSEEGILFKEKELLDGRDKSIELALEKVLRMLKLHYDHVAPKLDPAYVQKSVSVELEGWPFDIAGVLDLVEKDGTIRDTKVKAKTPSQNDMDADDQLTIYAMLEYLSTGKIPKLVFDCLIDTKVIKYVPLETVRYEEDFDVLLRRIQVSCEAINAGIFIPARETDWWCGKYQCGYWGSCPYVKKANRPTREE